MKIFVNLVVIALFLAAAPFARAAGSAEAGETFARQWCSQCHVVSDDQQTALADAPTFKSIAAKYGTDVGPLEAFLTDPHPPMPNLSLSRQELQDLIAYIGSLR
jgi:mono/diheme cytochrome c family protein